MKNWLINIDEVFLITLPENKRYQDAKNELNKYQIPFRTFYAIKKDNGADGLKETMRLLFEHCVEMKWDKVLLFEDDVLLLEDINNFMPCVLEQLPNDFDMCYLGCNLNQQKVELFSENLIQLTKGYALHAVIYSLQGMKKVLKYINNKEPIDKIIVRKIQPDLKCYCTYPMIATQRKGYSDIEKKEKDYNSVLEKNFNNRTKHLKW